MWHPLMDCGLSSRSSPYIPAIILGILDGSAALHGNVVSDQFTGLNVVTVPGTLCDSLNLLAIVLEQETELQPTEIMTDTAGYTDTIFGIFFLLAISSAPRREVLAHRC
jgi:TnpA family transposase